MVVAKISVNPTYPIWQYQIDVIFPHLINGPGTQVKGNSIKAFEYGDTFFLVSPF